MHLRRLAFINKYGSITPEELENFIGLLPVNLSFVKHWELNAPSFNSFFFNFRIFERLLLSELIAWESQDFETMLFIFLI